MSQFSNFIQDNNVCLCFVCDKQLALKTFTFDSSKSDTKQVYERFRSIVSRYLNLNFPEANKTLEIRDPGLLCDELECCKSCFEIVKTVCEIWRKWNNLQLELNWNLSKIGERMESCSKSKCGSNLIHNNQPDMSDFKRDFKLGVESMSREEHPHLMLDKIKFSDDHKQQLHSESVSVKLENDEIEESYLSDNHDDLCQMDAVDLEINNSIEIKPELSVKVQPEIKQAVHGENETRKKSFSIANKNGGGRLKQFQCSFCHKRFGSKVDLERHQRIHTGEKPYPCRICGQRFSRVDNRKRHEMEHNPEFIILKYDCRFCSKTFSTNQRRIKHEWTHTGLKPFQCSVCGRRFNDSHSAKRHIGSLHKDVEDAKLVKRFNSYKEFE